MAYDLQHYGGLRHIDADLLSDFETRVKDLIGDFCGKWEKIGYDYLHEVDEDEMHDACDANEWYFMERGQFAG